MGECRMAKNIENVSADTFPALQRKGREERALKFP